MKGELPGLDALAPKTLGDQLLGNRGEFALRHGPAHDVAAEHIRQHSVVARLRHVEHRARRRVAQRRSEFGDGLQHDCSSLSRGILRICAIFVLDGDQAFDSLEARLQPGDITRLFGQLAVPRIDRLCLGATRPRREPRQFTAVGCGAPRRKVRWQRGKPGRAGPGGLLPSRLTRLRSAAPECKKLHQGSARRSHAVRAGLVCPGNSHACNGLANSMPRSSAWHRSCERPPLIRSVKRGPPVPRAFASVK